MVSAYWDRDELLPFAKMGWEMEMIRYKFTEKIAQSEMGEEKIYTANADFKQF